MTFPMSKINEIIEKGQVNYQHQQAVAMLISIDSGSNTVYFSHYYFLTTK